MRLLFVLPGLFVSVLCCVLWSGKAYAQVQQPALQSSADLSNKENQLFCEIDPHSEAWSGSGLKLKHTLGLNPKRVSTENQLQPVYIDTDSLKGRTDLEVTLDGSVKLRRGSTLIKAERIEYFQPADQAKANGSV